MEPDPIASSRAGEVASPPPEKRPGLVKRTVKEFNADNLTDAAAALTYYAVLSIFPGLLVVAAVLGLVGRSADPVMDELTATAPAAVRDILTDTTDGLAASATTAGVMAIVGVLGALWAASGYVAAFMRTANVIYDVPEGRPIWKTLPIRVAVTVSVGVLLIASAVIVVFTGRLAALVGDALGFGGTAVTVWSYAKWPVLILLVAAIFSILYWASPNAKVGSPLRQAPGGVVAVVLWLIASAGFGFYVANFASYNKTYGTLGGVIVFFVWLWVSNLAILFGAELNAERERGRAIARGASDTAEPYVDLRDSRGVEPEPSWADRNRKPGTSATTGRHARGE